MTEDILQSPTPPGPPSDRRRIALAAVGGGLAVILLGAGALAVSGGASADNASPQPAPSASAGTDGRHGSGQPGGPGRDGFGALGGLGGLGGFGLGGAFGLPGIGPGDALHGTAVVKTADGTFQTVAAQHGKVTAVSPTSITVRSDDGYTATYVVDKDTVVNGPDGKIADITTGADVAVTATVTGDTSTAKRIIDLGTVKERMQQFMDHFGQRLEHPMHPGAGMPTPSAKASGASA